MIPARPFRALVTFADDVAPVAECFAAPLAAWRWADALTERHGARAVVTCLVCDDRLADESHDCPRVCHVCERVECYEIPADEDGERVCDACHVGDCDGCERCREIAAGDPDDADARAEACPW